MKVVTALNSNQRLHFKDVHPEEFARQITLLEIDLYIRINPRECVGQAWSKKDKTTRAPNITKLIAHFNHVCCDDSRRTRWWRLNGRWSWWWLMMMMLTLFQLSNWITWEIMKMDDQKQRAIILQRAIMMAKVVWWWWSWWWWCQWWWFEWWVWSVWSTDAWVLSQKCKDINNYFGTMAILSGIQNSSIYRLTQTWNVRNLAFRKWAWLRSYTILFNTAITKGHLGAIWPPDVADGRRKQFCKLQSSTRQSGSSLYSIYR